LVISSSGGTILAGTFADHVGGPGLHQKVPLRNYLGIKITDSGEIVFENFGTYDCYQDKFVTLEIKNEHINKLKLLQTKISKYLGRTVGLNVGVLNELPRRTGLNNPGANAANLTVAYLLITEQITYKDLDMFQNINHLLDKNKLSLIKDTAKEFHREWLGRKNAGFGVFSSMVNKSDVLVYNPEADYPVLAIGDIFKPEIAKDFPFDVVTIGTSDRYDIDFSIRKYDEVGDIFPITNSDVASYNKAFGTSKSNDDNFMAKLKQDYFNTIGSTGLAVAITIGKSVEGYSSETLRSCLRLFDSSYDLVNLFGQNYKRKNVVHTLVNKYLSNSMPDMPFAIATGVTNNLSIITVKEYSRDIMTELGKYLKSNLDFDISYPYISWLDDNDEDGSVIEKWDNAKIRPKYIPSDCLYLYSVNFIDKTTNVKSVDNRDGLENNFDILFDEDDKKIYIKGKKITSNELPTVKATISLLDQIVNSDNFEISSDKLPNLSYFHDRNELQSKIVSPLKIIAEQKLGKHLNIKISGSLSEYKIILYPSDISIGIIKRV
jgi:hypothetical protein